MASLWFAHVLAQGSVPGHNTTTSGGVRSLEDADAFGSIPEMVSLASVFFFQSARARVKEPTGFNSTDPEAGALTSSSVPHVVEVAVVGRAFRDVLRARALG